MGLWMNGKLDLSVAFFGKGNDACSERALDYIRQKFTTVECFFGTRWGEPFPDAAKQWHGDLIISFLSRWIIPQQTLSAASRYAINFHPGPPEYPGIGCTNFALYNGSTSYGTTCHHMSAEVDAGDIIDVQRFDIAPTDDLTSLYKTTYDALLKQCRSVVDIIYEQRPMPQRDLRWNDETHTRQELDALMEIDTSMDVTEISRRIRATRYQSWKPYIQLGRYRFELTDGH